MNIDTLFSRQLLKLAHRAVKSNFPTVKLKGAWVWTDGRSHWEFHGPDQFYWNGRAGNAYDARYKGWMAWLTKQRGE